MRAEEMRKKASMDPLTGLKNRRAMLNDIQEMLETLSEPLWLVCLDLDNFKSINDQYGHDIGDQYLQRFGTMLEEMTKQNGQAYRMGGDEFAVLYSENRSPSGMLSAELPGWRKAGVSGCEHWL